MTVRQRMLTVGRVSGVYGVQGWVRIWSYTKPRIEIVDYRHWHLRQGSGWRAVDLLEGRVHGKGVIARLAGVDDRDQAQMLLGTDIGVPREVLPELPEGQYYWSDLEGLRVENLHGEALGVVDCLFETGANDVVVVRGEDRERLIPFVLDRIVTGIDLDAGVMQVDWEADY